MKRAPSLRKVNDWIILKRRYQVLEDVNITERDAEWNRIEVKAFYNRKTGEVRFFWTDYVEMVGSEAIILRLNMGK